MEVNYGAFYNERDRIQQLISNVNVTLYDLLNSVRFAQDYWKDGYANSFFAKVNALEGEINSVTDYLYHLLNCINIIGAHYDNVTVLRGEEFGSHEWINIEYFFLHGDEDDYIRNLKIEILNCINYAENDIFHSINRVPHPYVQNVDMANLGTESISAGYTDFVGLLDGINDVIATMKNRLDNFGIAIDELYNEFCEMNNIYMSTNIYSFNSGCDSARDALRNLYYTFASGIQFIDGRKGYYDNMVNDMVSKIHSGLPASK